MMSIITMITFQGLGRPENLDSNNMAYVSSLTGAIYFLSVLPFLLYFVSTIVVFQSEKPLFVRERECSLYDVWVYVVTKFVAEIPVMMFAPFILNALNYFVIGFENTVETFLKFYLILLLATWASSSIGYTLSACFNSESMAVGLCSLVQGPLLLFGGYYISLKGVFQETPQKYIAWMSYFSPGRWAF